MLTFDRIVLTMLALGVWALLWPILLAVVVVVATLMASGAEEWVKAVGPVIGLFVVVPAFYRARRLITEPPRK